MGSRARLYWLPLPCNGRYSMGITGSAVCLYSGRSQSSLVNPLLNSCLCDTGNKYCTGFSLSFPEFLQIWVERGGFHFLSAFYDEVRWMIYPQDSFSPDMFSALWGISHFIHPAKHPQKYTRM